MINNILQTRTINNLPIWSLDLVERLKLSSLKANHCIIFFFISYCEYFEFCNAFFYHKTESLYIYDRNKSGISFASNSPSVCVFSKLHSHV